MKQHYKKVKDSPDLVKDENNNALLNTNNSALESYRRKRTKNQEVNSSIEDVKNMKEELAEVKGMLAAIIQKLG